MSEFNNLKLPENENFVAMVAQRGTILIASTKSVYEYINGALIPIEFVFREKELTNDN